MEKVLQSSKTPKIKGTKVRKTLKTKLDEAQIEIEELAMQLADMLGAALHYAGVKDENMPQAVEIYLDEMDRHLQNKRIEEAGYEDVVQIIDKMKKEHPSLFT